MAKRKDTELAIFPTTHPQNILPTDVKTPTTLDTFADASGNQEQEMANVRG